MTFGADPHRLDGVFMRLLLLTAFTATVMGFVGCGGNAENRNEPKQPVARKRSTSKATAAAKPAAEGTKEFRSAAPPPPTRTLADLAEQANDEKQGPLDPLRFRSPVVDDALCERRGIRRIESELLTLYTDLASSPAIDELPKVFNLAVPQWAAYFHVEAPRWKAWKMVGVLAADKSRFAGTGLWPDDLPPFPNGYMRDRQFWLYDQPSDYYRRELFLHEGTHGFMWSFLGSFGPPWYAEGMAELLGTHAWSDGKLTLGVVPPSKEASPMWGRVKILKDGWSRGTGLTLGEVMHLPPTAHLKTEAYGWCWGTAVFFDHDPKYQKVFREAPSTVADVSETFSERLLGRFDEPAEQIAEQWQCFVANIEYGYDVARESIVRKAETQALPATGAHVTVAADRGWQSSGYTLRAGQRYQLSATGRFQIGKSSKPWMSEPGGITLRYYKGRPIGQLLAAVTDEGKTPGVSPFVRPVAIGVQGELTPERDGVLYLRVNDSPAELADNAGELQVSVEALAAPK
jgi:hypothetical protein